MEVIQSVQNQRVKNWMKLHTAKGRKKEQRYLLEGWHLIEEALQSTSPIEVILVTEGKWPGYKEKIEGQDVVLVHEAVMKALSLTEANQGILAVMKMTEEIDQIEKGKILLVDAVQDPGNLGTMIRTADAAGFSQVVLGKGTVDLYNDKVLRSMQGSHFHLKVGYADLTDWIRQYQTGGNPVYAAALTDQSESYEVLAGQGDLAILVGNEGQGISDELLELCHHTIKIPLFGQAESLNVAIATGILLYKAQEGNH